MASPSRASACAWRMERSAPRPRGCPTLGVLTTTAKVGVGDGVGIGAVGAVGAAPALRTGAPKR